MKTLVAVPCYDSMKAEFVQSLFQLKMPQGTQLSFSIGSLVHVARGNLLKKAIDGKFDYILWLDSDMTFAPEALTILQEDAAKGMDIVSGLYFMRKPPIRPVMVKKLNYGEKDPVEYYDDYPRDSIFECEAIGMGICLTKVEVMKKVMKEFKCSPFEMYPRLGEDYSFCYRLAQMGIKIWCDSRVKCGHIGQFIFSEKLFDAGREK